MIALGIINGYGLVHRDDAMACETARRAPTRKPITAEQALVYALANCGACFPAATFDAAIGRLGAGGRDGRGRP